MVETTTTTASGSVLVNVAADAYVRLVRLLVDDHDNSTVTAAVATACTDALDANDLSTLVTLLLSTPSVVERLQTILANENDLETATGTVTLLAGLLLVLGESSRSSQQTTLLDVLLDAITKTTTTTTGSSDHPMQLLTVLYNILPESTASSNNSSTETTTSPKCRILVRLLQTGAASLTPASPLGRWILGNSSSSSGGGDKSTPHHHQQQSSPPLLTQLVAPWSSHDRALIYQTVCDDVLQQQQQKYQSQRQQFLVLLLAEDPTNVAVARQVVLGAVQHPVTLFQPSPHRHLLQQGSPVLQQLLTQKNDTDDDDKALVQLLQLVQTGQWKDYAAFVQSHGSRMTNNWGLDTAQCEHTMRMLSLCSLATTTTTSNTSTNNNAIAYSTIRDELQVPNDTAVERLVVDAVQSGLLSAQLDPVAHTVWIQHAVIRSMEDASSSWKQLQQRLSVWKHNVGHMLEALEQQQQQQQQAGQ